MMAETVASCFERVLQCLSVGPEESFFDLGGDSLRALTLLLEIKKATGQELTIADIYDASTVREMATLLERGSDGSFSPLVKLKPGGPQSPLEPIVLIHGVFGNVVDLVQFGGQIAAPRAVYAIQARGVDGREPPNESVAAMAAYYVGALKELQPYGPYLLVGYSFGGLVAIEMARLLRAAGGEVGFLGLIESYPPVRDWPLASRVDIWARKALRWSVRLAGMSPLEAARLLRSKLNSANRGLRGASRIKQAGEIVLPVALRRVREAGYKAWNDYRPAVYDGPAVFIRAGTLLQFPSNPRAAWRGRLPRMTVVTTCGDHYSMIGVHSESLADLVSHLIAEAIPAEPVSANLPDKAGRPGTVTEASQADSAAPPARRRNPGRVLSVSSWCSNG
jgi:acetoacetyl-CoA synthetase